MTSRSAHEYPAYALQIESLPLSAREKFLQSVNADTDGFFFNDIILSADPFYFAARAYAHLEASTDRCAHLTELLEGEVAFIATLLPLSP